MTAKLVFSILLLISLVSPLFPSADAKDYRAKNKRAEVQATYIQKDVTIRRALSIGRASGALTTKDAEEIYTALENKKSVPMRLANNWQKLLRVSQLQTYTLDSKYFFPVGYEFETVHVNHSAAEEFDKGSKKFQKLLAETVGKRSGRTYSEKAKMRDDANREWNLVREYVRMNDWDASGYEFVSPPIRDPGYLQDISTMTWRLGQKKFGQSNRMTGGHQTFTVVPNGETADAKMMGRVVANIQLLEAQYSPAIYDLLDIRRLGGPVNPFMRPIVLDHHELIESLKKLDPKTVELKDVHGLFFDKHVDKEFERAITVERDFNGSIDQKEFEELMKKDRAERAAQPKLWKYRDAQTKYNLQDPAKTLVEFRVGDWVADRPEQTMLKTFLYQNLLKKAWNLAKEGKIFQPNIPLRAPGESDAAYWDRMRLNPAASKESFLRTVDITDPDKANLVMGRNYTVKDPPFRALDKPSYAFEAEGWTDEIVDLIVPNDPKLRKEWPAMSRKKKLEALAKKGIEIGEYSEKAALSLSTEFRVDTSRFPHMNPDIILESSGNWEVTSNGRGLHTIEDLEKAAKAINRRLSDAGIHIHRFTPDSALKHIKKNPKKFAKQLERQSLSMALGAYAETKPEEAYHGLDSWSLDRFSPTDISRIEGHLAGTDEISGTQTKYHNIAFRPVTGGLDMEVRDIGSDLPFGVRQIEMISNAMESGDFGPPGAEKAPSLFMEFSEHADPYGPATKRYTLAHAIGERHKLTEAQKNLLHKLQFEIYKPSMAEYMYFLNPESKDPFWSHNDVPAKYLDPLAARTNFENNLAIPLLNYEEQGYIGSAEKAAIEKEKNKFLDRVYAVMQRLEKDPKYHFLLEEKNFFHLSDYLKRSTHPNAKGISFGKVAGKEAKKQKKLLEELTNELRGEVIRFVRSSKVAETMKKSLPGKAASVAGVKAAASSSCPSAFAGIRP